MDVFPHDPNFWLMRKWQNVRCDRRIILYSKERKLSIVLRNLYFSELCAGKAKASSNMLTAGAAAPQWSRQPPQWSRHCGTAGAEQCPHLIYVEKVPQIFHAGGWIMKWKTCKFLGIRRIMVLFTNTYFTRSPESKLYLCQPISPREVSGPRSQNSLQEALVMARPPLIC